MFLKPREALRLFACLLDLARTVVDADDGAIGADLVGNPASDIAAAATDFDHSHAWPKADMTEHRFGAGTIHLVQ